MEPGSPPKTAIADDAKELFVSSLRCDVIWLTCQKRLTIVDSASTEGEPARRGPPRGPPRPHRSSRAEEPIQYRPGPNGLKIPIRPRRRHPEDRRRPEEPRPGSSNRESRRPTSDILDPSPMAAAERAERERRRRDRESRHQQAGYDSKDPSRQSRRRRNVNVDVVDKLDVTGLYGVGGSKSHHQSLLC
jgi:hypothetical protein